MKQKSHSGQHLVLAERQIIEKGISSGSDKASIASTIGKDASTVAKEIRKHRELTYKCGMPLECTAYRTCTLGRNCTPGCPGYARFKCNRRDRSPGACNGCEKIKGCRYDHYIYKSDVADSEYKATLVDSRTGINCTEEELKEIGEVVQPLIKKGMSPFAVLQRHPEIGVSEHTLYNYIESGAFRNAGVDLCSLDLRRQPSRRPMKKKDANVYKKREDRAYLKNRLYSDYLAFTEANPCAKVVQMDTVYNDPSGPYMQTFKFVSYDFMFIVYSEERTQESMLRGVALLEQVLGKDLFNAEASVILTDRGTEFTAADEMEERPDGTRRTRLYYCDAMASGQKGTLENYHKHIRYICPKNCDLYSLGLTSQKAANEVASQVNSIPVEKLNGKTPWEYLGFMNPALAKRFLEHGLSNKSLDESIELTPKAIRQFRTGKPYGKKRTDRGGKD